MIKSLSPSEFTAEFNGLAGVELLVGERTLRAPLVTPGIVVVLCFSVKQVLFINETSDLIRLTQVWTWSDRYLIIGQFCWLRV